jgi:hypothetical protein
MIAIAPPFRALLWAIAGVPETRDELLGDFDRTVARQRPASGNFT